MKQAFPDCSKKGLILLIVAAGYILGTQIFGEQSSILENAGKVGIPLLKILIKVLEQLKQDKEE